MKHYIPVNCNDCLRCCKFHLFIGESMTLDEIQEEFFFNKEQCDTFFEQFDKKYFIGTSCIQSKNNRCIIHDDHSKHPFTCAFFPLILVEDQNKRVNIVIDKNCPQCKNVTEWVNAEEGMEQIGYILSLYEDNDRILILDQEELKNCGYELEIIMEDIFGKE